MTRISQTTYEAAPPESRALWDQQLMGHGRMTNMKRTLAHSPVALRALMEWYPLRAAVAPFLGERLTTIFAHAVSAETDCLICSTFFRRLLKERGEDPDHLQLDARDEVVVAFGQALAKDRSRVPDDLFAKLAGYFRPREIVELTSFGALMVATNIVNNALKIDLDEYLAPFRRP